MNSMRRGVLGGSFWSLVGVLLRAAIGFVSVPLTLSYLGSDRVGLWRIGISTLSIATFLRAGLVPHLKTHMAEAFAEGDERRFNEYSSTSILMAGLLVLLGIAGAMLAPLLNWNSLFSVEDKLARSESLPLMMVLFVLLMGQFATVFVEAIYDARLEGARPRIYGILGSLAGLALLLAGIHLRATLPLLAALTAAPWVLCMLPLLLELWLRRPQAVVPRASSAKRVMVEMARPVVMGVLIQLACVAVGAVPNLLVARRGRLADVTTFSICYQLATFPLLALSGILPVFWPAFTVVWRRGETSRLRRWVLLALAATTGGLLAFTLAMGFAGDWVVKLWTHGQVSPPASLLVFLGLFCVAQGCNHWITTFLWATSDLAILLASYTLTAGVLIAAGLPLTHRWGLNGLAIALFAALLVGGILLPLPRLWVRLGRGLHGIPPGPASQRLEESAAP